VQDIEGSIPVEWAGDIILARSTNGIKIILVREAFVELLAPSILSIWRTNNGVAIFIQRDKKFSDVHWYSQSIPAETER